jgi:hypothetical protein
VNKNARYLSALPDGSALVRPQSAVARVVRIDDDDDDAYSRAFMMTPLAAYSKQASKPRSTILTKHAAACVSSSERVRALRACVERKFTQ